MAEKLLTVKQLAERMQVKEGWVYRQIRLGTIPVLRSGKYRRFQWEKVLQWMESQG
ncbi:MAG: helix-turn-helix domain-containing protein [Nitrospina sp.]|nr:helix-turn-helix domain-containing protein [Nitrospina sp.]